jgi:hypothetical protein
MKANLEDPFVQGDSSFVVKPFSGFVHDGYTYSGVDLQTSGDARDIDKDRITLTTGKDTQGTHFMKPTNEFILKRPYADAHLWRDKTNFDKQTTQSAIKTGNGIAHAAYCGIGPMARFRELSVVFPTSMKLTDRPFVATGDWDDEDEEVEYDQVVSRYATGQNEVDPQSGETILVDEKPIPIKNMSSLLCFRLVDWKTRVRTVKPKGRNRGKGAAGIADKLAQGSLHTDDSDDE